MRSQNRASNKGLCVLTLVLCIVFSATPGVNAAHTERIVKRDAPVNTNIEGDVFSISYDHTATNYSIGKMYSSIALGFKTFVRVQGNEKQFAVNSTKFRNLLTAIGPAMARIGGTEANFAVFHMKEGEDPLSKDTIEMWEHEFEKPFYTGVVGRGSWTNMNITGQNFKDVVQFLGRVGWKLMLNLNQMLTHKNGTWDSTNAEKVLNFSLENDLPIYAFQLANEPNGNYGKFRVERNATVSLAIFQAFHDLLYRYDYYEPFRRCSVVGPGVTSLVRHPSAWTFIQEFFAAGTKNIVRIMGLHHYHFDGTTAKLDQFLDPYYMNMINGLVERAKAVRVEYGRPGMQIWLTETSAAFSGGAKELSDRFASTFSYLDLLGLGARLGISQIHRQNLQSAAYGLLDNDNNPNPDYWINWLFRKFIQGPVFNITMDPPDPRVRVYAGCGTPELVVDGKAPVVYYYMNLKSATVTLNLTRRHESPMEIYRIRRDPNLSTDAGLRSQTVYLNDAPLELVEDDLPQIVGEPHSGYVNVEKYSLGFLVDKRITNAHCGEYLKTLAG